MKSMTFTYTKSPSDITERSFIAFSVPTDKYFGVDISELSDEDQGLMFAEMQKAWEAYQENVAKIMADFDVKTMYRFFKQEKMSNIKFD